VPDPGDPIPTSAACAIMNATGRQSMGPSTRSKQAFCCALAVLVTGTCRAGESDASARFHQRIEPILQNYCYGCHGYGSHEGGHAFDEYKSNEALLGDVKLWLAVLKNVRSGVMPPPDEPKPTEGEREALFEWIERDVFKADPADPDPGRVTLKRLNRVEYRNTIRDLTGVDYDTQSEFPPDDSGYGFDNVGDALSVSPLLLEKYLIAAREIVAEVVPAPASAKEKDISSKYRRVFVDGPPPEDSAQRDEYAQKVLRAFIRRAYRRPADERTVERLFKLAKEAYSIPDQTFEAGIGTALVAVLSSPRFLYRIEEPLAAATRDKHPLVDEFALASRLSYFLWSTMPDEPLLELAERGELRKNQGTEVERMLREPRSKALAENFAGQWLRSRDIEHLDLDPIGALGLQPELDELQRQLYRLRRERESEERKVEEAAKAEGKSDNEDEKDDPRWQEREKVRAKARELRTIGEMFDTRLRRAIRDETEEYFNFVVREDRDVLEFVDSDYTFLNATLAKHYGISDVNGDEMRRVELSADSVRGGVLTQATFLAVTSNPNRTSPVKRGLFVLDNILGSPPVPPPPPNVPVLEAAENAIKDHRATVRELLEEHRRDPTCAACHARMDPLGLALENFNAMGMWRDKEYDQPVDATGTLLTGEKFDGIRQLKAIIKDRHRLDFYRCLAEKLLTYSLGRGLEYYDELTVDEIVLRMDRNGGKFSALLTGVIESAPFQKQRRAESVAQTESTPQSR
jgi:Protein of unknown function (DUF1588)/Protein of unknown function (DUF1587)/Protein of unknown function (DUF1592)/Protein of unknown function (DUF1585)/Protein of unknown function (DUF1595)/Planctomycete cytochrome C